MEDKPARRQVWRRVSPDHGEKSFNDLLARSELDFNSLAEFLGGGLDGGTENFGNTSRDAHQNFLAFYIQDGIHVNSRLTVNLGLRWDYFGVIGTDGDQLSIYNPSVGLVPAQSALSQGFE